MPQIALGQPSKHCAIMMILLTAQRNILRSSLPRGGRISCIASCVKCHDCTTMLHHGIYTPDKMEKKCK
jgi:hypothetical protein